MENSTQASGEFKLYIWRKDVLPQYGDGIAVAAARNVEEAREAIVKRFSAEAETQGTLKQYWLDEIPELREAISKDPEEVLDLPAAACLHGSD